VLAIVDTGPLYAVVDADDDDHERCVAAMERADLKLIIPTMVVAEATYLVGSRLGPKVESGFLRGLGEMDVDGPEARDWPRIAELVQRYGDFPLGGTDASVIATAERLGTDIILTLDRRHFGAVRFKDGKTPKILP
jgi:predicted nucleic acid-binding protein